MDLQISVFLLFVLFTAGHSFKCYECVSMTGSCAAQKIKSCPSGFSKCMSVTTVTQSGEISSKDCTVDCQNGSMNLGMIKASYSCCDTDLCNSKDAPDLSSIVPSGKTCYSCVGHSCLNIMNCSGSEDRCIKATGSFGGPSADVKGCLSKSICDALTSVSDGQGISCCSGNLCNSANGVTQSFLFLCCSLLSFILLH
ncbi:urokinase plasminogen activator surface receptor isoform X15 [Carassius gibelio]|uniref:urokinase plasminogen activator surface receptor isoform X15 n=2 Tax=Carassius gibelio TaxID=101364 RepID=UPI0022774AAD|nr:urokinase plasminogen activator surface receptor isoform X15 [Carassius gibelio]